MALTRKQKAVLDFIAGFVDQNGFSPSYQEIAAGLNLASLATVHKHIEALETKHYLKRGFNQSRSIDLAPKYFHEERKRHASGTEIPLAGRIAAGTPVEAIPGRDTLNLGEFLSDENLYALEVRGESMIEDHICDGDVVLVERNARIKDGDIVVALIGGEQATLKR
jgi:repressor LexA